MPVTITTTELSPTQHKRRVKLHIVKYVALLLILAIAGPLALGYFARNPQWILPVGVILIIFTVIALVTRLVSYVPSRTIEHMQIESLGHATRAREKADPDAV